MYKSILIENKNKLLIIKFNNPKKKNAFNREAYIEITSALNNAAVNNSITIVALTGVGDFYSSGNDISAILSLTDGQSMEDALKEAEIVLENLIKAFYNFPKILIAIVNGPCIGIAATTAALCDIVYCSKTAYFYTPFTKLGLCPEGCSSYTFPQILGKSKAAEMLLLNHKLTAEEALKFNFVSEIYETESKLWQKLYEFSELPSNALKTGKDLMRKWNKNILDEVVINEINALQKRWVSDEFFDAVSNFLQRKSKL